MRILGFMSGTSLDGVDAAILSSDGEEIHDFGPTHLTSFSTEERAIVKEATEQFVATGTAESKLLEEADDIIVDAHVRCARELLSKSGAGTIELDRKSVVEGKRGSVSVDLGGRGLIKKTKTI